MSKKEKQKYIDDSHVIYDMDVDTKWNTIRKKKTIPVPKDERKLLINAAFRAYIPKLLLVLLCFGVTIILLYFWLK